MRLTFLLGDASLLDYISWQLASLALLARFRGTLPEATAAGLKG